MDSTRTILITASVIGLVGLSGYLYCQWRGEERAHNMSLLTLVLSTLPARAPRTRVVIPSPKPLSSQETQEHILLSRIDYRSHEILEPTDNIHHIGGRFNPDLVMEIIERGSLPSNINLPELKQILNLANLHIWNRIFIHDHHIGLLDIRTDTGSDTVCISL